MKTFTPLPALKAWFDAMEAQSRLGLTTSSLYGEWGAVYFPGGPPPLPARPSDPIQQAFYDNVCMPLHRQLTAAVAYGTPAPAQIVAAPPV